MTIKTKDKHGNQIEFDVRQEVKIQSKWTQRKKGCNYNHWRKIW